MTPTDNTTTPTKSQAASYDIAKSDETLDLAKDLAKFIKENKLSTQVQGKEFVNVEGWQYAGSRLGIVPVVEHCINVSDYAAVELKYQAKVTLFDLRSQHTVGAGFAICSNKEGGKKFYQEFAIMSMAQTRAIGKAYRNILAWIIRAAGYEPTPAEEMEYSGNVPTAAAPVVAEPAPVMRAETQPQGDPLAASQPPVQYASAASKEEIIRLLDHPLITRQEKTKMLLNINRLDEERAQQAITKLKKAIEDREGTSAVAAPAGNAPAGETPAALPSAAPAASTTSDQSSAERLTELRTQFEGFTSTLDINEFYKKLTAGEQKQLLVIKDTALARVKEAVRLAASSTARQNGTEMKDAGSNTDLVEEFCTVPPATPGVEFVPLSKEQKEGIIRLLDHPKITRKEKTRLLLYVNKLDKERARQVLLKLRREIGHRENSDPRDSARAALKAFVLHHEGQLSLTQANELNALAEGSETTLEFLLDALDLAQAALLADENNGVSGDLDTETARLAA